MGKHRKLSDDPIPGGRRVIYGTPSHIHKINDILISPSGEKLESVLMLGNNRVSEYIRVSPSRSCITFIYKRRIIGSDAFSPRAEAAEHVSRLEEMFRYAVRQK